MIAGRIGINRDAEASFFVLWEIEKRVFIRSFNWLIIFNLAFK